VFLFEDFRDNLIIDRYLVGFGSSAALAGLLARDAKLSRLVTGCDTRLTPVAPRRTSGRQDR